MKNIEVVQMYNTLESVKKKKLPISILYILSRNMKQLKEVSEDFESARQELLNKYGEKDGNGNLAIKDNRITIPKDVEANFLKDLKELENVDISIFLQKIPMSSIFALDGFTDVDRLTEEELEAMQYMIQEEEVEVVD